MIAGWMFVLSVNLFIHSAVGWNPQEFSFASYLLTQNALDDAPQRYSNFIDQFESYAKSEIWPDYKAGYEAHCETQVWIHLSEASPEITLINNTLSISITDTGLLTTAKFTFTASVPVYYRARGQFLGCFSHTVCDNVYVNTNFMVSTMSMIDFRWNQTSESIAIVPTNVSAVIQGIYVCIKCTGYPVNFFFDKFSFLIFVFMNRFS